MSIYGPEYTSKQNNEVDISAYAKKPDVLLKAGGIMRGPIDMTGQRIVKLGYPEHVQDAVSKRYVDNYATFLQNTKVDYSGGTMTGDLNMGYNKITNVGDSEYESDAVNKKYVDERVQETYAIGRYIVLQRYNKNFYFSVRTKKNIDLVNNLSFEMINTGEGDNMFDFINNDHRIFFDRESDESFAINSINYSKPWTILFSFKPETNSRFSITFDQADGSNINLGIGFSGERLGFEFLIDPSQNFSFRLDNTKFNHIALECINDEFSVWINGKSKNTLNKYFGGISSILLKPGELKVFSIYHRNLSKHEIAEHFVEYQVKGSPNNEVLI